MKSGDRGGSLTRQPPTTPKPYKAGRDTMCALYFALCRLCFTFVPGGGATRLSSAGWLEAAFWQFLRNPGSLLASSGRT